MDIVDNKIYALVQENGVKIGVAAKVMRGMTVMMAVRVMSGTTTDGRKTSGSTCVETSGSTDENTNEKSGMTAGVTTTANESGEVGETTSGESGVTTGEDQRYALAVFSVDASLDEFEYLDFLKHPTKLCFSHQSGIVTFIDEGFIVEHKIGQPGHHQHINKSLNNDPPRFTDCASSAFNSKQIRGGLRYFAISQNHVYSSKDALKTSIDLKTNFKSGFLKFLILKNNDLLVADKCGYCVFSQKGELKLKVSCENLVNIAVSRGGFVFVAEETSVLKNKFTITLRDKDDKPSVVILLDEQPVAMDFCQEKLIVAFQNKIQIYE
jgi:hypothetical protein